MDEVQELPISVDILDTETGEKVTKEGHSTYFWTEGNGFCDCNRTDRYDESRYCLGCRRFLVVGVNPLLSGYTLDDFNRGYPTELTERFRCG